MVSHTQHVLGVASHDRRQSVICASPGEKGGGPPAEEWSRSGWLHSFLSVVMIESTPSEGSEALPDMRAATDLDLSTCLYSSTCKRIPIPWCQLPSISWQSCIPAGTIIVLLDCCYYHCYDVVLFASSSAQASMQAVPATHAGTIVCCTYPIHACVLQCICVGSPLCASTYRERGTSY